MDLGLAGAAVCVQGGSSGMGLAAAECFAADGARVAVLARDADRLARGAKRLVELGSPDVVVLAADITDAQAVVGAFALLEERWGELNTLVNAAGPPDADLPFEQITDEQWIAALTVGALGAVRCTRAALPLLRRADWARVVNVSAHSTKRQSPFLAAYTAAKSAMTSVSKNLSLQLAPDGILVNTVSPGSFASDSFKAAMRRATAGSDLDPDDLDDCMRWITETYGHPAHLGRAGDPAEIGPVICFVGSRRNSYMTGANVNVDGGSDFC